MGREQKGYVYNFPGGPCAGFIWVYKFFDTPSFIKGEVLISACCT